MSNPVSQCNVDHWCRLTSSVTAICWISDSRGPDGFGHCPRDESNLVSDLRAELENAGSNRAEKLELTH